MGVENVVNVQRPRRMLAKLTSFCALQASLATVHNLWIAVLIGALLTGFLWFNAPWLIQGEHVSAWQAPAEAVHYIANIPGFLEYISRLMYLWRQYP